eukprot:2479528-Prymnesium_polylepis.1
MTRRGEGRLRAVRTCACGGWRQVLADGRAFNALGACEKLGIDAVQLNELWVASKDKLVKLGGGFYCW